MAATIIGTQHGSSSAFASFDRRANRFEPIKHVYSVVENGKAVTRGWWVEPHSKYGLPGPFDRDVTIILYELVNDRYFSRNLPIPEIMPIGSFSAFAEKLGVTVTGPNIARIRESLKRLKNTLVDCEETFFDTNKKRYVSLSFRLLKGVGFAGEDDGHGQTHEENFVIFDECILRNLNAGYAYHGRCSTFDSKSDLIEIVAYFNSFFEAKCVMGSGLVIQIFGSLFQIFFNVFVLVCGYTHCF